MLLDTAVQEACASMVCDGGMSRLTDFVGSTIQHEEWSSMKLWMLKTSGTIATSLMSLQLDPAQR